MTDQQSPSTDIIADDLELHRSIEIEGYELGVKRARTTLFVIAGLLLLAEVIRIARDGFFEMAIEISIIAVEVGVFIGLAFWTKRKPFTAIIIALVLFVIIWAISIYGNGLKGAIGGIIIRFFIFYYLIVSLKDAKALEKVYNERVR